MSFRPRVIPFASACWLVASLAPNLAFAEEPSPPASARGASAAAQPASPEAVEPPSPEALREAKQRFDRGFELYEEGEYSLALIEFSRAYELVPNYRVLYNIGQVCIQLGQYANARRALEEYLDKGSSELGAERRAAVQKDLEMLGHRTAFLTISVNVDGAEVLVDDVAVGKAPLGPALLVDAGVHRVTVRRPGYLSRTSHVTLAGGDEQTVAVSLEPQPEAKPTIVVREREVVQDGAQPWIIAGWITTGALAAGAVVTGIMGASEADELEQLRRGYAADYDDLAGRIDETKSNAGKLLLASDVMTGAALIVGGLSLWITLDPPDPARSPAKGEQPLARQRSEMQLGYADGRLQLRGRF